MAADDKSLRIACRLVCSDQWLVTHVDPTWPVLHLKHFLLHKFHCTADDGPEDNLRTIPVSPRKARRRSLSPITFAAPLRKPQADPVPSSDSSLSDCSDPDLDDDLNITKAFTDAHRYKYNARPSTSSASDSVARLLADNTGSSTQPDGQSYVLLTFSTTQILEDRFSLSWYGVHADELLELHPAAVSFVSLSRCSLDAYITPYFAARVWALRIIGHNFDSPSTLVRNRPRDDDGTGDIKTPSARDKGKRKVAVEWKERWAIIHQGMFSLCKERHDTHTTFSAPLSSLLSIRDSAPFNVPLHARRLRKKTTSRPASNVICIRFNTPMSPRHRTFSNESMSVGFEREPHGPPSSSQSASSSSGHGGWWRRSRDVSTALSMTLTSSASVLVGSGGGTGLTDTWFARRGSKTELDEMESEPSAGKGKGKERDEGEDAVWIVMDMLDNFTCSHILRILHRHAPSSCHSTFLPSRPLSTNTPAPSPIIFSKRSSITGALSPPTSPTTPGPTSSFHFPPTPLSPAARTVTSPFQSARTSTTSFPTIGESQPSSPTLSGPETDVPLISHGPTLPYPGWRMGIVRAARRAGLGAVGRAMELVMFGDEDEDDLADIEDAGEDDLAIEWARRTSSVEPSPIDPPVATEQLPLRLHVPHPSSTKHLNQSPTLSSPCVDDAPASVLDEEAELQPDSNQAPPPFELELEGEQLSHPPWQTHPFADLSSILDTEPSLQSEESEAEWDGWVDAVLAQRKQDTLMARARARQAALARSDSLATPSGNPPAPYWGETWTASGTPSPVVSASSPYRERGYQDQDGADEELDEWHWPRGSDTEGDAEESSAHSSDPQADSQAGSKSQKGKSKNRGGHKTLSSYSSVDSLFRRTIRSNIISFNQAKRASMQILFPSASASATDVVANAGAERTVPTRAMSASPPAQITLSRPSLGSMRSATSMSMASATSTRSRPFSPLTGSLSEDHVYDAEDGYGFDFGLGESGVYGERHVDVDDVEEPGNQEGDTYYESELGHPVPLPGMRMVPSGYTTFQHSSLYGHGSSGGGGAGAGGGDDRVHAGVAHGQSMQRLPMGMTRMMTTVSSTVSVGPSARRGSGTR